MPELATHWIEASAGGDPTRAIECSRSAGEQAAERRAFETAATWFERALELIDDDDEFESERRRVLVELAEAQAESGATVEAPLMPSKPPDLRSRPTTSRLRVPRWSSTLVRASVTPTTPTPRRSNSSTEHSC